MTSPKHLSAASRKLFREIAAAVELDAAAETMLTGALEQWDRAQACRAQVAADGLMLCGVAGWEGHIGGPDLNVVAELVDLIGGAASRHIRRDEIEHFGGQFARNAHLFDVFWCFDVYGHAVTVRGGIVVTAVVRERYCNSGTARGR